MEEKRQDVLWAVVPRSPHPAGSPGLEKSPWVVLLREYSIPSRDVNDPHTMELLA